MATMFYFPASPGLTERQSCVLKALGPAQEEESPGDIIGNTSLIFSLVRNTSFSIFRSECSGLAPSTPLVPPVGPAWRRRRTGRISRGLVRWLRNFLIHEKKAESSFQAIKGVDSKLVEMILNEVIPRGSTGVTWADVSGQTIIRDTFWIQWQECGMTRSG